MARRKPKITLPTAGRPGLTVETVEVADPYEPGAVVKVSRNVNHSSLALIAARGRLADHRGLSDSADARLAAGERLRAIYERSEIGGAKAIDYSAVKVDVSFAYRGVPDTALGAANALVAIQRGVGPLHWPILFAIVCEDRRFDEYGQRRAGRFMTTWERIDLYQKLRDALDALIEYFGVAVGRYPQRGRESGLTLPR